MLLFLISCGTISVLTSGILRFENPDSIDAVVNDSAKVNNKNIKSKLDTHQPKLHLITPPPRLMYGMCHLNYPSGIHIIMTNYRH